jgi:hypothetical protein
VCYLSPMGKSLNRRSGFALMTVLLFSVVLAMLVGVLLLAVRHDKFRTLGYSNEIAASYVAEAGVADVLDQLMDDPNFDTDLIDVPVDGRPGTYTVTWKDPSTAGPTDSVNNMSNAGQASGPRGANSVPANSAEILVVATVGSVTKTTQLIAIAPPDPNDAAPMAATGNILMKGNITVDAVDGLDSGYVSGGRTVHSNNRPGTVEWKKQNVGDEAVFDGDVTCSCSQSTAVNMEGVLGSDYYLDSEQRAVPTIDIGGIDVAAAVGDNTGHPSPTFNPSGQSVLPAGNYHVSGNVNLSDDLILEDGANLFVSGDLTVDGAVTGNGKVMVDGKVSMYGDTFTTGSGDHFVSMMSSKNLVLSGYDAHDRLAQLAGADPALDGQLAQLDTLLGDFQAAVDSGNTTAAETARLALGEGSGAQLFAQIKAGVDADPNNDATKRFLQRKMDKLSDFYGKYESVTGSTTIMSDTMDGSSTDGLVDFALRRGDTNLQKVTQTLSGQINRKELGYTHFRGVLYTSRKLRVDGGVSILGAALANDGTGGGNFDNFLVPVDGTAYEPTGRVSGGRGVIDMRGGTRLTVDRALMSGSASGGGGSVRIAAWLRR